MCDNEIQLYKTFFESTCISQTAYSDVSQLILLDLGMSKGKLTTVGFETLSSSLTCRHSTNCALYKGHIWRSAYFVKSFKIYPVSFPSSSIIVGARGLHNCPLLLGCVACATYSLLFNSILCYHIGKCWLNPGVWGGGAWGLTWHLLIILIDGIRFGSSSFGCFLHGR